MSRSKDKREISLASPQRARRLFLRRAVLTTAAASIAPILPADGQTVSNDHENASPRNCPANSHPMREVRDKVAFVTGGSSGIGLGIARAFSNAGMRVAIGYRTQKHVDEALQHFDKAGRRVHAINVDVTDRASMDKAAAEVIAVFGAVHVLVNNAGVAGFAPLSQTSDDDWRWMMNVNVNGVFNGVQAFLPRIVAHGLGGHIITTASLSGLFAVGGLACYTASKFAVVGLMEALRADLVGTNIGVSVCCPNVVPSRGTDSNRNRPSNLPKTSFNKRAEMLSFSEAMRNPKLAIDPLEVGQLVLQGMRNNDLYILTHPGSDEYIRHRNEALLASSRADQRSIEERTSISQALQKSIYRAERDHKLCSLSPGDARKN